MPNPEPEQTTQNIPLHHVLEIPLITTPKVVEFRMDDSLKIPFSIR
ncbi:MAG: hypothetical protein MRQ10_05220 [Candidatus Midichloria mitochondrii]|nr:hypothetical protein [Candidatus Midichloria mitochondrii]